jgi:NAD(P)-dependent dehydrogenase (short-subunit alcohol dehydrogenase family)
MNSFEHKIAVVTGGASGIGRALCDELAARGALVVVADIDGEGARRTADAIRERGGQAAAQQVDVAKEESVRRLIDDTAATHGRLDYLFNNAGVSIVADARDLSAEHWRRLLDINLGGVLWGTVAAYAIMVRQGFGHIVNMSSLSGLLPHAASTPYAMTKHAITALSLSLRLEGEDLGVKVSVACPAWVKSHIYDASPVLNTSREKVMAGIPFQLMDTDAAAREILSAVARNRAIVVLPRYARIVWFLYRHVPWLLRPILMKPIRDVRAARTPN